MAFEFAIIVYTGAYNACVIARAISYGSADLASHLIVVPKINFPLLSSHLPSQVVVLWLTPAYQQSQTWTSKTFKKPSWHTMALC